MDKSLHESNQSVFLVSNLPPNVTLATLIPALMKIGNLIGAQISRDDKGLPSGSARCSFETSGSPESILSALNTLVLGGARIRAEIATAAQKPSVKEQNVIQQILDQFSRAELRDLLRNIRHHILHNGSSSRAILNENPHLSLAILYALQRVKPSIFHHGDIPDEYFTAAATTEVPPIKRKHETQSAGICDASGPSVELIQMIQAMSPDQLRQVANITPNELSHMPPDQRVYMQRVQRYVLSIRSKG